MSFFENFTQLIQSSGSLIGQKITINDVSVTIDSKIADGGYGIIYKALDDEGHQYALKALQVPDQEHLDQTMEEYKIQELCCKDANIVQVYGYLVNNQSKQILILMEYCQSSLVGEMNKNFKNRFNLEQIVKIFVSVCSAVNYMHTLDPPITHRDLKVENVLLSGETWKLCDFGSATTKVYHLDTAKERNEAADDIQMYTTPLYRAPEMCDLYRREIIDTKADVWALGCILFKLATFADAFGEGTNLQILNLKYRWPENIPVDQKIKDIVAFCFEPSPKKRPTVKELLGRLFQDFPGFVDKKWKMDMKRSESYSTTPVFNPFADKKSEFKIATSQNTPKHNLDDLEDDKNDEPFNPFGVSSAASCDTLNIQSKRPTRTKSSNEKFDPFGSASKSDQSTFDPFNQPQQFNSFGGEKAKNPFVKPNNPSGFNPFGSSNSSSQGVDPFELALHNDDSGFSPLAEDTNDPFERAARRAASQNNINPFISNKKEETFDPFESSGKGSSDFDLDKSQLQNLLDDGESLLDHEEDFDQNGFSPFQKMDQDSSTFDPFEQIPSKHDQDETFNPFEQNQPNNNQNMAFNPFEKNQTNLLQNNTFNPFESDQSSLINNNTFNPFEQNQPINDQNNAFNPFGDSNTSATFNFPNQDTFDPFNQGMTFNAFNADSPTNPAFSIPHHDVDPNRMTSGPDALAREILDYKDGSLQEILSDLLKANPQVAAEFIIKLLHMSGEDAPVVVRCVSGFENEALNRLWASRKGITSQYLFYNGDLSLIDEQSLQDDQKVINDLTNHLKVVDEVLSNNQSQSVIDETKFTYKAISYLVGKAKDSNLDINSEISSFEQIVESLKTKVNLDD